MSFDDKMADLSYDELSLTAILNEYSEPRHYRDEYDEHVSQIVRESLAEHIAETDADASPVDSEIDRAAEKYFYEHDAQKSFGESKGFDFEPSSSYFTSEGGSDSVFDRHGDYGQYEEQYEDYDYTDEDETSNYDFSNYSSQAGSSAEYADEGYEEGYTGSEYYDDDIKIYDDVKIYEPELDRDMKIYGAPAVDISYGKRSYNLADFQVDGVEDFRTYTPAEGEREDAGSPRAEEKTGKGKKPRRSGRMSGLSSLLAMLRLKFRRERIHSENAGSRLDEEEDLGPEAGPKEASRYYGSQIHSLRSRARMAALLTIIASWISLGLPVFGALRTDLRTASLVLLIIQLAVMMVGLDVFTAGATAVFRGRPGIWSLLSLTLVVMALDAAVTASVGVKGDGLPYSALGCLCMSLALYSALQQTRALRYSAKALELIEAPYTVTTEADVIEDGRSVLKSQIVTDGFIKTAEAPSLMEEVYTKLVFPIVVSAVALAAVVSVSTKNYEGYIHYLSGILAASLPFVIFVAFPTSYARLARVLFHQGAAVASWEGVRDIGRSRHMIVTDSDIFPPSAISIEAVRILDGMWPESIISAAGSIICASGSGLAPAFMDLMKKNNCEKQEVEDFYCHEGGGLTARINGMEVICGSVAFMNLMSIRIPRRMSLDNCVYLAINRTIMGIFTMNYRPLPLVKAALNEIMTVKRQPYFAIRDFLVTPLMIRNKFKISTDGFEFPTFERRYEISSVEPGQDSQVSAVLTREGLGSFVLLTERVRKLYMISLFLMFFALAIGFAGMLLLSYYPLVGAFALADVKTLLFYMLLSLIPGIILNIVFIN